MCHRHRFFWLLKLEIESISVQYRRCVYVLVVDVLIICSKHSSLLYTLIFFFHYLTALHFVCQHFFIFCLMDSSCESCDTSSSTFEKISIPFGNALGQILTKFRWWGEKLSKWKCTAYFFWYFCSEKKCSSVAYTMIFCKVWAFQNVQNEKNWKPKLCRITWCMSYSCKKNFLSKIEKNVSSEMASSDLAQRASE